MNIVLDTYLFDALESERRGVSHSVDFDDIWETFGYSTKSDARRYVLQRSRLKRFNGKGFSQSPLTYQLLDNNKLYLSVDSYKFALARANSQSGQDYLVFLLEIEKAYRAQLERQLLTTPREADNTRYTITCWKVHQDSGIKDPYYVRDVIVGNYDYKIVNQLVCVTRLTYEDLLENFRSTDGANISELPLEKRRKFHKAEGKKNKREPQFDSEQLSLF